MDSTRPAGQRRQQLTGSQPGGPMKFHWSATPSTIKVNWAQNWNEAEDAIIYLDSANLLATGDGAAYTLIPSPGSDIVYFESGTCTSKDYCQSDGVFTLNSEGVIAPLTGYGQPVFSPDGELMALC